MKEEFRPIEEAKCEWKASRMRLGENRCILFLGLARLSLSDLINALISVHVKYMIDTYINSSLIVGLCEYLHSTRKEMNAERKGS